MEHHMVGALRKGRNGLSAEEAAAVVAAMQAYEEGTGLLPLHSLGTPRLSIRVAAPCSGEFLVRPSSPSGIVWARTAGW